MVQITGPNEGINYNYPLGTFWKDANDDALRFIDGTLHLGVIDKDLVAQPGSPTLGDRYILPAGATGADWATHDTEVAIFTELDAGNAWEFHIPKQGWQVFVQDETAVYYWTGTLWKPLASRTILDLATTGATPLDLNLAKDFRTPGATGNVTLSITNIPAALKTEVFYTWIQDAVGGRTLAFPAGTQWNGGAAPTPSAGVSEKDEYKFTIDDAGVIFGETLGQAIA